MKRLTILLLTLIMALSLSACGGGEQKIELTTENITDYLTITVDVTECKVNEDSINILGMSIPDISGNAEIEISTIAQSDVNFEDVEIVLTLEPRNIRWSFVRGNKQRTSTSEQTINYKEQRISIPFSGETTITDELELDTDDRIGVFDLERVGWEVTEVSGYVIIN